MQRGDNNDARGRYFQAIGWYRIAWMHAAQAPATLAPSRPSGQNLRPTRVTRPGQRQDIRRREFRR